MKAEKQKNLRIQEALDWAGRSSSERWMGWAEVPPCKAVGLELVSTNVRCPREVRGLEAMWVCGSLTKTGDSLIASTLPTLKSPCPVNFASC
jgi:hypothetical protein